MPCQSLKYAGIVVATVCILSCARVTTDELDRVFYISEDESGLEQSAVVISAISDERLQDFIEIAKTNANHDRPSPQALSNLACYWMNKKGYSADALVTSLLLLDAAESRVSDKLIVASGVIRRVAKDPIRGGLGPGPCDSVLRPVSDPPGSDESTSSTQRFAPILAHNVRKTRAWLAAVDGTE